MRDKSGGNHPFTATLFTTVIRPGDFPLGTAQSRAAARALSSKRSTLSQDDDDALLVFQSTCHFDASMEPNCSDLKATAVYRRGEQLHDKLCSPVVPAHLDKRAQRSTRASLEFEYTFGHEPVAGDVLAFEHLKIVRGPVALKILFGPVIEAWHRRLPQLQCPYKFEGDRLFRHLRKGACSPCNGMAALEGGWHEAINEGPEEHWRAVEQHVTNNRWPPPNLKDIPTIPAVVFLGVIDGEHRCRPVPWVGECVDRR